MRLALAFADPQRQQQLARLGAALGHEVVTAPDSTALLRLGLREELDLILFDLHLGPLQGAELVGLLKDLNDQTLLVPFVTSNDARLEFAVRALGVFYYMLAPLDPAELEDVLQSATQKEIA